MQAAPRSPSAPGRGPVPGTAATAPAPDLDLPRLVMRRAFALGLLVLLLATALGLKRVGDNIEDEVSAAMSLATVMARLGTLEQPDDRSAIATLRDTLATEGLRHLELRIIDSRGRALLRPAPVEAQGGLGGWLLDLHRHMLSQPDARRVSWQIRRPTGAIWTVSLSASHESERIEALTNLAAALGLLLACIAGLLGVMRWNVRRALAPLGALLAAIARIEQHDSQAMRELPPMPIRELEAIAAALRHLTRSLDEAEARRRLLSQKVLTLQEDERAHLARELHDEFGQRLTALRFDAAWLLKRLDTLPAPQTELVEVVRAMADRCAEVQRDTRDLLVRLRPLGPVADAEAHAPLPLSRLIQLLRALVHSWQRGGAGADGVQHTLVLEWLDAAGHAQPPPPGEHEPGDAIHLPRELALTVYRLSQEALTNAARHAGARRVQLKLSVQTGAARTADGGWLSWSVADDGVGIADPAAAMQRGNGLGGMQERVWALGGEWFWGPFGSTALIADREPDSPEAQRPGLRVRALIPFAAPPRPADT